jgi:serine/threonine protein kinase
MRSSEGERNGSDATPAATQEQSDQGLFGTTIGKYEILSEIGRGGTGVVYLAQQRDLERKVALKALHGAGTLSAGAGVALVAESRLAGSLNHPNIVTVYEYLGEAGTSYIAMEYVPRGSLRLWVGYLSLAQIVGVLEGLLAGLTAVEPRGIVHRDLKPENVMVTADGRVKIADFGIAKASETATGSGDLSGISGGVTVGTPAYMAPEQALGREVGPWTDLYSLGVMAYEHLVGQIPFHDSRTPLEMLVQRVKDPIPSPADVDPRIDKRLSDWVTRLLSTEPERRPQSAAEAWEELEEIAIEILDPRWRREARLANELERDRSSLTTPAHFVSQRVTMRTLVAVDPEFARTVSDLERLPDPRDEPVTRVIRRDSRRGRRGVATAAALPLVVLAGFLGARASSGDPTQSAAAKTRVASAGVVLSSLPHGWRIARISSAPFWSGDVKPSAIVAPRGGSLTAGVVPASSAALIPQASLRSGSTAPERASVSLGGRAFYRYSPATLSSGSAGAIYTQPTTKGVLLAVCQLPAASPRSVNVGCEQILAGTELTSGKSLPPEQSGRWVDNLNRTTQALDKARTTLGLSLSRARDASSQAAVCAELARAVSRAATALQSTVPGPSEGSVNREIASSLDSLRSGYQEMADGARHERPTTYYHGRALVGSASASLSSTLAGLRTSG